MSSHAIVNNNKNFVKVFPDSLLCFCLFVCSLFICLLLLLLCLGLGFVCLFVCCFFLGGGGGGGGEYCYKGTKTCKLILTGHSAFSSRVGMSTA